MRILFTVRKQKNLNWISIRNNKVRSERCFSFMVGKEIHFFKSWKRKGYHSLLTLFSLEISSFSLVNQLKWRTQRASQAVCLHTVHTANDTKAGKHCLLIPTYTYPTGYMFPWLPRCYAVCILLMFAWMKAMYVFTQYNIYEHNQNEYCLLVLWTNKTILN